MPGTAGEPAIFRRFRAGDTADDSWSGDGPSGDGPAGDDSTGVPTNPVGIWVIRVVVGVLGALGLALGTADVGWDDSRMEGSFGVIPDVGSPVSS